MFWEMNIPQVKFPEIPVSIELLTAEPALFKYLPENKAVFLDDSIKTEFLNGLICPNINEATLTFNLTSTTLGDTT